jgi:hypothetical protein
MSRILACVHLRNILLYGVTLTAVLSFGSTKHLIASDTSGIEGPSFAMETDQAATSEDAAQPEPTAQAKDSTQSEKSTTDTQAAPAKTSPLIASAKSSEPKADLKAETKKADEKTVEKEADAKSNKDEKADAKEANDNATAKKENKARSPKHQTVGEPLAPGMIKLLQDELREAFVRRGITDRFARFQSYMIGRVSATAGKYTGSELTGNCRIQWYNQMMHNVVAAPAEAERFTRDLHKAASNNQDGLATVLAIASMKMDAGPQKVRQYKAVNSPDEAMEIVKQALSDAQVAYCGAVAPLSKSEIRELETYLVPVLTTQNHVGHTVVDRGEARRLCDLMEKMDRPSLYAAAEALAPVSDIRVLEQLQSLPADGDVTVTGVEGKVVAKIDTPSGTILIGGKENNVYRLDDMTGVAAVVDLGGNDTYLDGTVGTDRPVLMVIDLSGNDVYRGTKPGIEGASVLGVSMLLDLQGDDTYQAQDLAQGSTLGGVGILIDYAGNDRYVGVRRMQGTALGGVGILMDRAGKDDYHAAMWGQGVGGPLGFGLLDDATGDDHYFCGGMWRDSYYPETPGCEGWGQGVGGGIRQSASGGIGVILDGAGDDVYEFDYLSHGGGYWCGLGFARDFGGNDQYLITRTAFNGGPRVEPKFQRFGCGWGCHYAMGFMLEDGGNDTYEGTIMGTGMAWDCSMGVLADLGGDDHYLATGGLTQGTGGQMGFGVLFDYNGDDIYEGYGQGYASNGISYHDLPTCGGNFGFVVDYGGKDRYGCGAQNNSYIQRGDRGGFLIDRPAQNETEPTATQTPSHTKGGT